ncbi:MAG: hypothetical protein ACQCXQ_09480 [Verrucomicrobiales bacterium]
MKRPLAHRIIDRIWSEAGDRLQDPVRPPEASGDPSEVSSVSSTMEWPRACAALAAGTWTSHGFRRRKSVRQVVETLAPSDGRHFAKWIASHHPEFLNDPRVRAANDWGDPIQAPSRVLGTTRAWSPTSLRYLAHAHRLLDSRFNHARGTAVEIGVGFGGLSAMLAICHGVSTAMVDLQEVERAAALQMAELELAAHAKPNKLPEADFCLISNYAFTELPSELQDAYIDRYLRHAQSGVILSNARVFSGRIGGRSDEQLVGILQAAGVPAEIGRNPAILGPADRSCGVSLIHWNHAHS